MGGGAAGLTLAYWLCRAGLPVTVIEKENTVGGLARSFHYGDYHFDIGPHRFYTANPLVMTFLNEVYGGNYLEISRSSAVYYMNKYHDWPLKLSTVAKLPPSVAVKAGFDLIFKALAKAPTNDSDVSFKSYVLQRYGKTLYETFFKDYTEKFVGIPTEETHRNWAKVGVERATIANTVNTASLWEIFKLMLLPKPAELNFWYPKKGGIHSFWQACAQRIQDLGGEIICGAHPEKLLTEAGQITGIVCQNQTIPCETLLWSGSVNELTSHLSLPTPGLTYRSQIIYNILLKQAPLRSYQWCYYGAKDLVFSRLSNPAVFAPDTVPSGKGGLCAEFTCQEGDQLWKDPESIREQVIKDVLKVKIIPSAEAIEAIKIERAANAYPIYRLDYRERLAKLEEECAKFSNLRLLGRTGKFWYNNMDHSIENALEEASAIISGRASSDESRQDERYREVLGMINPAPTTAGTAQQ